MNKIVSFIEHRQYKSISNIEIIDHKSSLIDLDYNYKLNLQTVYKLSNTVDIYLNKIDIVNSLIEPLEYILDGKINNYINREIINKIYPYDIGYYKFILMINKEIHKEILNSIGCKLYLDMNYIVKDNRFINIKCNLYYKFLLFKHKPKNIQPAIITLSMKNAEEFLNKIKSI